MSKCLLIIDIQNDYFPGGKMELYKANEAANKAAEVLMNCRMTDLPIIFVQHIADINSSFFIPDSHGAELHDMIRPLQKELIIQKSYPNAFRGTSLLEILHKNQINEIILCGMMTHMCVDTSVRAAYDLGFECTLISDACATKELEFDSIVVHPREVQTSYLSAIDGTFAKVIKAKELSL